MMARSLVILWGHDSFLCTICRCPHRVDHNEFNQQVISLRVKIGRSFRGLSARSPTEQWPRPPAAARVTGRAASSPGRSPSPTGAAPAKTLLQVCLRAACGSRSRRVRGQDDKGQYHSSHTTAAVFQCFFAIVVQAFLPL